MRLLITADLHYNHPRSRKVAEELIADMNRAGGDGVLLVGDTAVADGEALEEALGLFRIDGPRLFLAGNHELWTHGEDSYRLFHDDLPRRVRAMGWRWLEGDPFIGDRFAIVGSMGWYDYSLAEPSLGIPERFYAAKSSPGAAERVTGLDHLLSDTSDVPPHAREIVARWNDGKFVKLHRSDAAFVDELIERLARQLDALRDQPQVIAAIHHLPFRELLPPRHTAQWDFAKAYLGSERFGQLLLRYPNVRRVYCGHSHYPAQAVVGPIHAINLGSGYRAKNFVALDLPE